MFQHYDTKNHKDKYRNSITRTATVEISGGVKQKQNLLSRPYPRHMISIWLLAGVCFAMITLWQEQQRTSRILWSLLGLEDDETIAVTIKSLDPVRNHNNSIHSLANESRIGTLAAATARFRDGSPGYIADPTLLHRRRKRFLKAYYKKSHHHHASTRRFFNETTALLDGGENSTHDDYDDPVAITLRHYESYSFNESTTSRSLFSVCQDPGGQGKEGERGWQLLRDKIRIHPSHRDPQDNVTPSLPVSPSSPPRLFCAIYTHSPRREQARVAALTWGYKCHGFLAFTTETIPNLGMVHLVLAPVAQQPAHEENNATEFQQRQLQQESYGNIWQKTRSIWSYVYQHYLDDYDYFHLGGDDMYVLVENLYYFLQQQEAYSTTKEPRIWGQWIRQKSSPIVGGGAGYTLNRAAIHRLVQDVLPHCFPHKVASYEDKLVSYCLRRIGVVPSDTREVKTGEQQYHSVDPERLFRSRPGYRSFQSRNQAYWETLPFPKDSAKPNAITTNNTQFEAAAAVGARNGLESAARYSVSFHLIRPTSYMLRLHAILYRNLCAPQSPLGLSLLDSSVAS